MGDKKLGIVSMSSTIDLLKDDFVFKIPVYMIQGEEDILTPEVITKEYFKKIIAPKKKYILLRKTEHGFNLSAIEMQYKIMKEYLQPLINR
jgi:pimeloyl-ACP methyl ester carboxylesterase